MKTLFRQHDGSIVALPESNSSVSAVLKNAIDWVSRADSHDKPMLSALSGKAAKICAASPGCLGGIRGLVHLRSILGNIGITVLQQQIAVGAAHQAFGDDGSRIDEKQAVRVRDLGATLADHLAKIHALNISFIEISLPKTFEDWPRAKIS